MTHFMKDLKDRAQREREKREREREREIKTIAMCRNVSTFLALSSNYQIVNVY